jgi:hypothetical protein
MKRITNVIIKVLLGLMVVLMTIPSYRVEAATKKLPAKTVYMQSYNYVLTVDGVNSVKGLKSSNRKVLQPFSCHVYKGSLTDTWFTDEGAGYDDPAADESYATMYFTAKKKGTSTISFTSGNKKYTQKVTVKKYVNPLKKLTISNVNGGQDIHDLLKNTNSISIAQTASDDPVRLTAQAASGWQITGMDFENSVVDDEGEDNTYNSKRRFARAVSSTSVILGSYNQKNYTVADITLRNQKNKGEIKVTVVLK